MIRIIEYCYIPYFSFRLPMPILKLFSISIKHISSFFTTKEEDPSFLAFSFFL